MTWLEILDIDRQADLPVIRFAYHLILEGIPIVPDVIHSSNAEISALSPPASQQPGDPDPEHLIHIPGRTVLYLHFVWTMGYKLERIRPGFAETNQCVGWDLAVGPIGEPDGEVVECPACKPAQAAAARPGFATDHIVGQIIADQRQGSIVPVGQYGPPGLTGAHLLVIAIQHFNCL